MSDGPLSVAEAAAAAGVHPKTLRRAIARGDLRAVRPRGGRRIVILAEDLQAWRDEPVVPRSERPRGASASPTASRRAPERGSLAALRAMERSTP